MCDRSAAYPSLQKYSYLKEWSFNTLPTWVISLISHHLLSTSLKQQWHQQLPLSLSGSPWKAGSVQKSWQTNRCYSHPLPSPGPPSPWSTGNSRWCHFPVHVWKTEYERANITQRLPYQNFYSCSWPHHLKQMYLHEALPCGNNNLPAPIKPSPHTSDRAQKLELTLLILIWAKTIQHTRSIMKHQVKYVN